jgi:hypothetical protein
MSGPIAVKAPWFVHKPMVASAISMDGFEVKFTPDHDGRVWAIVRIASETTKPGCVLGADCQEPLSCDEIRGLAMNKTMHPVQYG